jgi:hypothetical protein
MVFFRQGRKSLPVWKMENDRNSMEISEIHAGNPANFRYGRRKKSVEVETHLPPTS